MKKHFVIEHLHSAALEIYSIFIIQYFAVTKTQSALFSSYYYTYITKQLQYTDVPIETSWWVAIKGKLYSHTLHTVLACINTVQNTVDPVCIPFSSMSVLLLLSVCMCLHSPARLLCICRLF